MNKIDSAVTFLLIILAIYWGHLAEMPKYEQDGHLEATSFSTDRSLMHVKRIAEKPHGVGFPGHTRVREYIVAQLKELGLETSLQSGYTSGDYGNFSKATNILARIKGTENGKALLLLAHYDSSPHSSLGASDDGSGVATILEGIRSLLAEKKTRKNDIIILISDAEELGLNGADLFVNEHPWAKDVGLVLNFEARGSGGPSFMLIETNRGNARLIEEFTKANPQYPVANSLAYSIYKMLPNDTDLTIFREDGDIEGFNFAFIDDHFDYHTVRDDYDRLDRNTLSHQGSYLMPLLRHFSDADLNNLKSLNDYVYFNVPFFKLVSYPFEWIWPMIVLAGIFFILLVWYGFRKNVLVLREILKGFLPLLLALFINGVVGYYCWPLLKSLYPQYKDILQGFTYNGHTYIWAFALLSVGVCFACYHWFRKISTPNLLIAPLMVWWIICTFVALNLKGASFFIIPVFALLASLFVTINQKAPSLYLLLFFGLPALWLYAPLIEMFPVGLGLKTMVASTIMATLTFVLLLPLFGFYTIKKPMAGLGILLFIGFMIDAHITAGFTKDRAKPTSLLYVMDADTGIPQWATYENVLSDWTANYIGKNKKTPEKLSKNTLSSKYASGFTYVSEAPIKNIPLPLIEKTRDTLIGDDRMLEICIKPQRPVNRLELFTNAIPITKGSINGIALSQYYLQSRKQGKLLTHYISNNDDTELALTIPKDSVLELTLYEASNDLLDNPIFAIPPRPENAIPMPFVLNDAVLVIKTIRFE
ncbi:MAG: M28 family peptidase [Maribacter sp.]|nr:M28 family peptidase [Maribacter sp.]